MIGLLREELRALTRAPPSTGSGFAGARECDPAGGACPTGPGAEAC
ncbi:hypothetical protein OJF2_30330 [Aquisphaera giovannonii]|uniref:Uncharacterized protein n=1 Tax=Aquisphaera giovannonii TaxID=406548 RepID=A0A5B9W2J1_9BACT|nr:hypothetical protein OJF2_30330 [Aquisphaera giovannonii]